MVFQKSIWVSTLKWSEVLCCTSQGLVPIDFKLDIAVSVWCNFFVLQGNTTFYQMPVKQISIAHLQGVISQLLLNALGQIMALLISNELFFQFMRIVRYRISVKMNVKNFFPRSACQLWNDHLQDSISQLLMSRFG